MSNTRTDQNLLLLHHIHAAIYVIVRAGNTSPCKPGAILLTAIGSLIVIPSYTASVDKEDADPGVKSCGSASVGWTSRCRDIKPISGNLIPSHFSAFSQRSLAAISYSSWNRFGGSSGASRGNRVDVDRFNFKQVWRESFIVHHLQLKISNNFSIESIHHYVIVRASYTTPSKVGARAAIQSILVASYTAFIVREDANLGVKSCGSAVSAGVVWTVFAAISSPFPATLYHLTLVPGCKIVPQSAAPAGIVSVEVVVLPEVTELRVTVSKDAGGMTGKEER